MPAHASDSKRVKVAVAGLGAFGSLHALAYSQNPAAILTAVCDSDPERLESIAKSLRVQKKYTDFAQMLDENDDLSLVSIATPDHQHFPMAENAARRGLSILLEKPMCSTIADADKLVELARRTGSPSSPPTPSTARPAASTGSRPGSGPTSPPCTPAST